MFPNLGVPNISYKKEEHSHQVAHETGVETGVENAAEDTDLDRFDDPDTGKEDLEDKNPEEYFLGDKNDNHENAEHPMHGAVFSGFVLGSEKLSGCVTGPEKVDSLLPEDLPNIPDHNDTSENDKTSNLPHQRELEEEDMVGDMLNIAVEDDDLDRFADLETKNSFNKFEVPGSAKVGDS